MKYKSTPEELQQRKRDFIDTYKPKPTPKPFFGFLKVPRAYKKNKLKN